MQLCGGCSVQEVSQLAQVLMNPAVWVVVLAGAATLLGRKKEVKK